MLLGRELGPSSLCTHRIACFPEPNNGFGIMQLVRPPGPGYLLYLAMFLRLSAPVGDAAYRAIGKAPRSPLSNVRG